jgi:hypothetical protein
MLHLGASCSADGEINARFTDASNDQQLRASHISCVESDERFAATSTMACSLSVPLDNLFDRGLISSMTQAGTPFRPTS